MADERINFNLVSNMSTAFLRAHLAIEFIDLRTPEQRQDDLQRRLGQVECGSGGLHGLWCSQGAQCSFCMAVV